MKLSILIPTLPSRYDYYKPLLEKLYAQIGDKLNREVEVLSDPRVHVTVGEKRNYLYGIAQGKYAGSLDDDDDISDTFINDLLEAAEQDPDVITFDGWMSTDGKKNADWEIKLGNPYIRNEARETTPGIHFYERFPNHLAFIRTELARKVKFEKVNRVEDYPWAKEIHDRKLLKTGVHIPKQLYHYKYRSKK